MWRRYAGEKVMLREKNASKEVIIKQNELKVDMKLNSEHMILCGTCMCYSKEKQCIVGLSCIKLCIFKDYKKIKQITTDACGNYYTTVPKSKDYMICLCNNKEKKKQNIVCNNSHFCMKHFIFNIENSCLK